jgi:hypothetical protein
LNHTVASTWQAFGDEVEVQLPDDIMSMMYMLKPIPEDDNTFLYLVELAGKSIEKIKWCTKARKFREAKQFNNTKDKHPGKVITKTNDNRKENKKKETYKNN